MSSEEMQTLDAGEYKIELNSSGLVEIYKVKNGVEKIWLASADQPQTAMDIVEGLMLVETKRHHYPESNAKVFIDDDNTPTPPFLRKGK